MVHWGWLVAAAIAGIVAGAITTVLVAAIVTVGVCNDIEAAEYDEIQYVSSMVTGASH